MRNMMSALSSKSFMPCMHAYLLVRSFRTSMEWHGDDTYKLLQFNSKRYMLPRCIHLLFVLSLSLMRARLDLPFNALMNELIGLIYQWTSNVIICGTKSHVNVRFAHTTCWIHTPNKQFMRGKVQQTYQYGFSFSLRAWHSCTAKELLRSISFLMSIDAGTKLECQLGQYALWWGTIKIEEMEKQRYQQGGTTAE